MNRTTTWMVVATFLSLPSTHVWATNLDAFYEHYEYYETISHDKTKIKYRLDSPDPSDPGHEVQTEIFSLPYTKELTGLTGGACLSTNNNNCIFGIDNASSYTYTHFLFNPNLSPSDKSLIQPLTADSLIEFSLKLKIEETGTGEVFDIVALGSMVMLATMADKSSFNEKEIEFNLYDDAGNSVALDKLHELNLILASFTNPNGALQINITGTGAADNRFKLVSSQLEVEYTVPEPASLLLLGSGLLAVGAWGWRRRTNS